MGSDSVTIALQQATIIEGRVLAADTASPIPGAAIAVESVGKSGGWLTSTFHAVDQGRFQANPFPADRFRVRAFPNGGQPYFLLSVELAWSKGAVKKATEIKLPRGVVIKGKVAPESTGQFGRWLTENGSGGTDHSTAAPVFLLGQPVKAGLHGSYPDLTHLEDGDPIHGVDFRRVYATLFDQWLGVPHRDILGADFEAMPLLRS
jgi:Protein of unknown function (DUF1501)